MKQGEIYRVSLDPITGYEFGGERLVVVVSNDQINNSFLPVVIVPLTIAAGVSPPFVFSALVTATESGLSLDVLAECVQVRALDQSRFTGAPEGALSHAAVTAVEKALHKVFRV